MLEHRLRIDTVDDGIQQLSLLLDALEKLQDVSSVFNLLDEAHATAEWAESELENPRQTSIPDLNTARQHFETIREHLEGVTKVTTDDGFAHEHVLEDMHTKLKTLRQWLVDAQLDYERKART